MSIYLLLRVPNTGSICAMSFENANTALSSGHFQEDTQNDRERREREISVTESIVAQEIMVGSSVTITLRTWDNKVVSGTVTHMRTDSEDIIIRISINGEEIRTRNIRDISAVE